MRGSKDLSNEGVADLKEQKPATRGSGLERAMS